MEEELIKKIINKEIGVKELIDNGVCPTCFDKSHNHILYGDNHDRILYEDEMIECFLDLHPKSAGHTIILVKEHYKDMIDIPDDVCVRVFVLAKKLMKVIKEVYGCESVYLCTMCDGPINHFHLQLLPRYNFEKRGSKNFVKERMEYQEDKEKIAKIRDILKIK